MIRTARFLALLTLTTLALLGTAFATSGGTQSASRPTTQVLTRGVHPACDIDWCAG